MLGMNAKLARREESGNPIRVGIVGAGQMGAGMVAQMALMKGMRVSMVVDILLANAERALVRSGVPKDQIKSVRSAAEATKAIEKGHSVITDDADLLPRIGPIDAVVDATGVPEVGAKIATESILNGKHVVMLNVEADIVIGPSLKKLADSAGVVYTGSAGDEPGAVKELYDFADALGFEIRVIGKGKNNKVDLEANPDSVRDEATSRGVSPKMLASFKDGTKTMVELTAMSNATGFVPGVRGAYGTQASIADLNDVLPGKYMLKKDGGILDHYGIVDYVDGIAPGVFIIVTSELPDVLGVLKYLRMGNGPNYTLFRPYHLTSLETPLSVAKAVIDGEATIVPEHGLVSETIAVAKRDLKAGEMLDGIGGFSVYGTIETHRMSVEANALPLGLVNKNTRLKSGVPKGDILTYDMVELDQSSLVVQLRRLQDRFS